MVLQSITSPRLNRPPPTMTKPTTSAAPPGSRTPSLAGTKRPASLLPAFEPLSSPSLPRPAKRQNRTYDYPTPAPTSSTGILSSSPIRSHATSLAAALRAARSPVKPRGDSFQQTCKFTVTSPSSAAVPERVPLSTVPSVELPADGSVLRVGRSSNSSDYQLPANRHISRVHLEARFIAGTSLLAPHRIEIICIGWNGFDVHCQGRTYALLRGDSFTCEDMSAPILLNVHESRVLIQWPKRSTEEEEEEEEQEPVPGVDAEEDTISDWESPSPAACGSNVLAAAPPIASSPLCDVSRMRSPVSPSPPAMSLSASGPLQALLPEEEEVHIYEDEPELPPSADADEGAIVSVKEEEEQENVGHIEAIVVVGAGGESSDLSDASDAENDAENDPDEENDPIIHSFGPFGANITGRSASFSTNPLETPTTTLPSIEEDPRAPSPPPLSTPHPRTAEISHHAINQLAFSRLSSTPLSTILLNLPSATRGDLTSAALVDILQEISCVGIIERHGKDAAGKPLEAEYYYMPEADDDEKRRGVVSGMRKPSLRACRKQHKQYFWKRPKTP